ncbi:MAG: hypothetical protein J5772_08675 [Clostridia bacterium]|nr:hypothetical protein [Clostridia bacterium]
MGGTVVFFRVFYSVVIAAGVFGCMPNAAQGVFTGMFEMTNGIELLCRTPSRLCLSLCAALLSFGGVCIFIQSKMLFEELSAKEYFTAKLILAFLSGALFYLFYPLLPVSEPTMAGLNETLSGKSPDIFSSRISSILCGAAITAFALAVSVLYSRLAGRRK